MTLAHPLVGLILGKELGYTTAFIAGAVFPDIDHLFVLAKNRHFNPVQAYRAMREEEKYGETYKTVYTHSILAWLVFSSLLIIINHNFGLAFGVGYFTHLILDAIDTDEKQYFYPFKKKFKGFLPVFSVMEIIAAIVLTGIYFIIG